MGVVILAFDIESETAYTHSGGAWVNHLSDEYCDSSELEASATGYTSICERYSETSAGSFNRVTTMTVNWEESEPVADPSGVHPLECPAD